MFNIDEFKAQGLVYGGARPTLFQVVVSPPPGLNLDLLSARKFELTARATTVPEQNVDQIQIPYMAVRLRSLATVHTPIGA
jgi:hypothetical protein